MLKSMTGFGKGEACSINVAVSVEIKAVNHRYCDISIKLPRILAEFENEVKKTVGQRLKRGKIDVYINLDLVGSTALHASLNRPLVAAYLAALAELKQEFDIGGEVTLDWLASQKDLIQIREADFDREELRGSVQEAVKQALTGLEEMRTAEGAATAEDVRMRLEAVGGLLDRIEALAPEVPREWRLKLEQRLKKFADEIAFDPQRLAQELAIFADRCDVSEEVTRFRSHIEQFNALVGGLEPVGRKMDFLVQEMNREANTTGSKSNHAELTALVVEIKAELEKIREQVQNVE